MSWELAALPTQGRTCSAAAHRLRLICPHTAAQHPLCTQKLNLPKPITPSLRSFPWIFARVSLGAVLGSVSPQRPFPGAGGLGAQTACPSPEQSQGCARAQQSQDRQGGVTPGHGAGLPCSLPRLGCMFSFFFLLSFLHLGCLEAQGRAEPRSPAQTVSQGQGLTLRVELSVPGAGGFLCLFTTGSRR